jgi:polysaccharide export outer membrane protein
MKKIILFFCFASLLSCATKKEVLYFQDLDSLKNVNLDSLYHHPVIQVNDILKIDLTALEPESLIPFRFEKTLENQTARQLELLKIEGYLVNKDGEINFPGLGKVKVSNKTTQEVQASIQAEISRFVKDVNVKVRLVNFKFTVMGEVKTPGTYSIAEETISLPQALGMAGDLTVQGVRSNILIIRTIDGRMESKRIDLTKSDWVNSSYYYLSQNDLVYVEPNNPKIKSAGFIGNVGNVVSVISILLTSAVLIFR